jgi:hypothetical protein
MTTPFLAQFHEVSTPVLILAKEVKRAPQRSYFEPWPAFWTFGRQGEGKGRTPSDEFEQ